MGTHRAPAAASLLLVLLALSTPPPTGATTYTDLLTYLKAVGNTGKNFVAGLLAPRFDVRRALELLRGHLTRPWPAAGLPCLDPLDLRDAPFHLDDPDLGRWCGRVERARVMGLSTFRADALELEPLALSLTFNSTWRRLDAVGRYALNGSLAGVIGSRGRGPFNVTLWDVRLWGRVRLGSERPMLYVRELELGLALGAATGRVQGLRGPAGPAADPASENPRALRLGELLSETTLDLAPVMVDIAGSRIAARLAQEARAALDGRLREGRAASSVAMAWARAAAATERVLAVGRPAASDTPLSATGDASSAKPFNASASTA